MPISSATSGRFPQPGCRRDRGGAGIGSFHDREAGLRVPCADGVPFGRGSLGPVGRNRPGSPPVDHPRRAHEGEVSPPGAAVRAGAGSPERSADSRPGWDRSGIFRYKIWQTTVRRNTFQAAAGTRHSVSASRVSVELPRLGVGMHRRASRAVMEEALAHVIKDKAEAAYARSDLFDRRRRLMADWAPT